MCSRRSPELCSQKWLSPRCAAGATNKTIRNSTCGSSQTDWLCTPKKNTLTNTLTRPPATKSTEEQQNAFISRVAILEIAEVERPCLFKTSTHLVSKLIKFDEETDCFYVQPYNQSGDKDGKAQVEAASDLWVFPPIGAVVKIAP